jgi:large subunit ribosomal protein L25
MQAELLVTPREHTGKKEVKQIRREGMIPGVLYGHGFEALPLTIEGKAFKSLLRHDGLHGLLVLNVEGVKDSRHTVLIKELQRHPLRDEILHVDFQKIRVDEELTADVSLIFTGEPEGVKAGGILQHYLYDVTVQCLPKDLPEAIEIDISHLELKENLRISDLPSFEGVRYLNNPEEIMVAVAPKRIKEELEVAEEAVEEEGEVPEEGAAAEEEKAEAEGESE